MKPPVFLMVFFTVMWCVTAAYAEECRTASELVDYVIFYGMFVVENGDKLHLSYEQPTAIPMFSTTVTEIWVRVGEGYCPITGGHMS